MANTLKLGAGKWATGKDTVLAFNDENNNFKPMPLSFSRASSATVVNQSGLIETVGSGTPRIDFLGNTKGALKLEPSRTNLLTYSNDFSQSVWLKSQITQLPNQITSPEGVQNATLIANTSETGNHNLSNNSGNFTNASLAVSFYAKKKDNDFLQFGIYNSGSKWAAQKINLATGAVLGSGNSGFHNTPSGVSVTDVGSNWWRVETLFTASLTSSDEVFYLAPTPTDSNPTGALGLSGGWTGATTENAYVYGIQVESNSSYATSYIPTSGSAVTRVADACSQTVPDGVIGQTEGTFYLDFKKEHNALETWSINDGSSSNRVYMGFNNSDFISQVRSSSGAAQASFTTGLNNNTRYKCALAYKFNDFVLYINGVQIGTDNSGVVPLNMSKLSAYASTSSDAPFFSPTNDVKLYNTRLSNSELQALTTI